MKRLALATLGLVCLPAARPLARAADSSPLLPLETRQAAQALSERAFSGSRAAEWVRGLTDHAGPRLAGSPGDRAAVSWALETMKALHFSNVRAEKVTVGVWQRGIETGEIVAPNPQKLALTALGGSIATPVSGLEAEILEVDSLEALEGKGEAARGKIVFFDTKMERASDGSGYGRAVGVRGRGASRASKLGAVGVLIRSIGTDHNRTPHTGGMDYEKDAPKIPAAALSIPDAELLDRICKEGKPVHVRFTLTCGERPEAESANVIGEVPGKEKPDEIVLLGAHLDSWDLGTGAIDDGAGCGIVLEAARLIAQMPRRPRRTIRVVLYANEENGLAGGTAYAKEHEAELQRHVAALEADSGTGRPTGFSWNAGPSAQALLEEIASILEPLGAGRLKGGGFGGADVSKLLPAGVPLFSIGQDASRYFDYHHTANDTFDKIEPEALDATVAAVAAFAYCAASVPEPFERIPADKRGPPKW